MVASLKLKNNLTFTCYAVAYTGKIGHKNSGNKWEVDHVPNTARR